MSKISMAEAEKFIYNNMKEKHKQQLRECAEKDKESLIHRIKLQFVKETKCMEYVNKSFRTYLEEIMKETSEQKS